MSRARNIKPGFFKNEILVSLPFETRLLFIGLWTMADREGRLEDRPMKIKMEIFPADNVDVNSSLESLAKGGFIDRYMVGEQCLIQILAWSKHQNPHPRESASTLPKFQGHAKDMPRNDQGNDKDMPSRAGSSDSLIPDPLTPIVPTGDESEILSAYREHLPHCQGVSVLNPKRRRRIRDAIKLARSVCAAQGWPYEAARFWHAYFSECARDPWMRGEVKNPNNPNWKQNLDVLIAEDRFAGVMDRAIERLKAAA